MSKRAFLRFFLTPTAQFLNLAVNIQHKQGQLLSVLCKWDLLESELTVPAMETNFTIAEMKEHSIMNNLAFSNLQVITESSRSGPKFKPMI